MTEKSSTTAIQTGVYRSTLGDFKGAAIFLIDTQEPDAEQPTYLTLFNPENNGVHELTLREWQELVELDGLVWQQEIPLEIKDQFLNRHSFAHLQGLNS